MILRCARWNSHPKHRRQIAARAHVHGLKGIAGTQLPSHAGDHLHPNDASYSAVAHAIDLKLFSKSGRVSADAARL
jgi:hypothetical protein